MLLLLALSTLPFGQPTVESDGDNMVLTAAGGDVIVKVDGNKVLSIADM